MMGAAQAKVARSIGGDDHPGPDDRPLRLEDPVLAEASQEDLERIMEPALRAIVEPWIRTEVAESPSPLRISDHHRDRQGVP
jgi:hypothetical protein